MASDTHENILNKIISDVDRWLKSWKYI
jgi:hypothetical protein